ncbi:CHC2 zinc finger domain-containing protein [Ottowia pentelensis]|uniref:CHC2 zinc finger domain-containing protein n=1 Tax=Ottowia pentelensis TaxID=511108 RepID=A0ABV6PTA7_9BURK
MHVSTEHAAPASNGQQHAGRSGFDRTRLPDPTDYYTGTAGLKLRERKGKWRTTACNFHGGHDSMRVNTQTGAYCCMAGCGARGGDVLAYHMAAQGLSFIDAAKALGAWAGDGRAAPSRPAPLPARDALQLLAAEVNLVAVAAGNIAQGVVLTRVDLDRLLLAAGRILKIGGLFA